jgi:ferric-dicitrate binding protein FerR (iron transport regulator)
VNKINKGEIAYKTLNKKPTVEFNTLTTPVGGQFSVVLPDGSKIWLNAASSVYFPTAFTSNERRVTITGEAYFEVTHNINSPFIVTIQSFAGNQPSTQVQVLGTHFNINSYTDELDQQVTLLEGSVKVFDAASEIQLAPGEQADVGGDQKIILRKGVDTDGIVAWKNGEFSFQEEDIQSIMRKISRWYDVEVVYEGQIGNKKFTGDISRNSSLDEVLKIMEVAGIQFRIEGKKLIVRS